jgi:hypothetical protein
MTTEQRTSPEMRQALREQLTTRRFIIDLRDSDLAALLDDADALAGALAEVAAWRALVEDTDHRLKRINGEEGYITFYTMPAGIWHRFLAAARGGDVRGIVGALKPAPKGAE